MEKKGKRDGALVLKTAGFPFMCVVLLQYMSQAWPLLSMLPCEPGWMPFLSPTLIKMTRTVISLDRVGLGLLLRWKGEREARWQQLSHSIFLAGMFNFSRPQGQKTVHLEKFLRTQPMD